MLFAPATFGSLRNRVDEPANLFKIVAASIGLIMALFALPTIAPAQTLNITEFAIPTPSAAPTDITPGPDGALWFTEANSSKIGRITTSGIFTEYSVPLLIPFGIGNGPNSITAGPDGALWFALTGGIGRITTSGVVTEFNFNTATSLFYSEQITNGSDGALWFLEGIYQGVFQIGRISTAGVLTLYPGPKASQGCSLTALTSGPDGAIWFVDFCNNSVGRMSTTGVVTEYPASLGGIYAYSGALTIGPDNALWFATNASSIGRITTTGVVTEYSTITNVNSLAITTGPDGALWFTTNWQTAGSGPGPLIGRITTGGEVTMYNVPDYGGGENDWFRITVGPDGALWYPEASSNKIARLQVPSKSALSHIVAGGGWSTVITLINTSATAAPVTLNFHNEDGSPLSLPITASSQGATQTGTRSSVSATVNPHATLLITTGQPSAPVVGWADVSSTSPIGGFAIFRYTPSTGLPSEGTVPLQTNSPVTITLPYDDTAGFTIGVALANLSSSGANVTATVWDDSGNQLGTQNINLAASGHTSFVLPTLIPIASGKRGIVQFESAGGLSGLGLRFSPLGTFTSVPTM